MGAGAVSFRHKRGGGNAVRNLRIVIVRPKHRVSVESAGRNVRERVGVNRRADRQRCLLRHHLIAVDVRDPAAEALSVKIVRCADRQRVRLRTVGFDVRPRILAGCAILPLIRQLLPVRLHRKHCVGAGFHALVFRLTRDRDLLRQRPVNTAQGRIVLRGEAQIDRLSGVQRHKLSSVIYVPISVDRLQILIKDAGRKAVIIAVGVKAVQPVHLRDEAVQLIMVVRIHRMIAEIRLCRFRPYNAPLHVHRIIIRQLENDKKLFPCVQLDIFRLSAARIRRSTRGSLSAVEHHTQLCTDCAHQIDALLRRGETIGCGGCFLRERDGMRAVACLLRHGLLRKMIVQRSVRALAEIVGKLVPAHRAALIINISQ